jgi:hypothetical protein
MFLADVVKTKGEVLSRFAHSKATLGIPQYTVLPGICGVCGLVSDGCTRLGLGTRSKSKSHSRTTPVLTKFPNSLEFEATSGSFHRASANGCVV